VCRPQPVTVDHEHAELDRFVERGRRAYLRRVRGAKVRAQRDGEHEPAHGARQRRHAGAQDLLDRVRQWHVLADRWRPAGGQCASHLEGEQRVPQRGLEHPAQDVPRQA
jgi:hypothetical protein